MSEKKAIVIGAGIAGLASAVRLSLKGYAVDVYEQSPQAGGKLTEFMLGQYRFDFGPSLFTMPQYVLELFELADRNPADYFQYQEINEACRYFYPDGTRFTAYTDEEAFVTAALETFDVNEKSLRKFIRENAKIFENAGQVFLTKSIHKLGTWFSAKVLKSLTHAYVFDMLKSMHKVTSQSIKDPRLVQLYDRYATYNGSSPFQASSILNSISSLEHQYGTYAPVGGMSSIARSIEKLAVELGTNFHFNQKVDKIIHKNGKASGVQSGGKFYEATIVVSNMDVQFTYDTLLDNIQFKGLEKREKSSSAMIFYWGIERKFEELGLHNIFFSENYEDEFTAIFERKEVPNEPTIYVNISSKHSSSDVPSGSENWFVMINVPAEDGQDWDAEQVRLRAYIIKTLSNSLHIDIESAIKEEYIADPRTIRDKTLSHKGALYGTSSNHWLSAFLRHPNFSRKVENLYFVGGTVHPGGGIPLCLLSAKIMSELIK